MSFAPENWQAISGLLDAALDLPSEERASWLEALPPPHRAFREQLRLLLAAHAAAESGTFLGTIPKLHENERPELHDPTLLEGNLVGPYRLVRELGRGGMGSVWLAERSDGTIRRRIALKLPLSNLPQHLLAERFARERDILAGLTHAHIARLYDAGVTQEGRPYLALEYVDGQPLNTYCDERRLPIKARLALFFQVLSALQYAHAMLVVHRDLKPSNILVTPNSEIKLLDFGISKLISEGEARETELTRLSGRALTPQYASPEQILGQPVGIASDVYALGVVLYELLTGSPPYRLKRDSRGALEDAILSADAAPPSKSELSPEIAQARGTTIRRLTALLKGDLDTIVLKALKKSTAERYATAQLFADDLRRYLAGEAVLARPDSAWYRTKKFARRNWLGVGAAGAVMSALAIGLGVALWQAQVARTQARAAQAVQVFLLDIFQANSSNQSDPQKARNTTARELLDVGARKIDATLNDTPEPKITVYSTLGQMYKDLGMDKEAAALHMKRAELARRTYGQESLELVAALIDAADALQSTVDDPQWKRSLDEAQTVLDRRGDGDSRLRARLLAQTANYYDPRDHVKAAQAAEAALALMRRYPPDREFIDCLSTAAVIYSNAGQWSRAIALYQEAIALAQGQGGFAQPDLLPGLFDGLGGAYSNLGNLPQAESSLRHGWEMARGRNGDNHVETLTLLLDYASQLFINGRSADAIGKMEQAIAGFDHVQGADAIQYRAYRLQVYGMYLGFYGRIEDADAALKRAGKSLGDTDSPRAAGILAATAQQYIDLGRYKEAEAMIERAIAMDRQALEARLGGRTPYATERLRLLLAQKRTTEAADLTRSAIGLAGNAFIVPLNYNQLNDLVAFQNVALAQGNAQAALTAVRAALDAIEHDPLRDYYRIAECRLGRIAGKAQRALGKPGAAVPELRRSLELAGLLFDNERSPELADTQIALAQSLLDLHVPQEAGALADKARKIQATHRELGAHYKVPLEQLEARLRGR